MNHSDFIKLLQRHSRGETSEEENNFIFSYYDCFENEPDAQRLFVEEEKQEVKEDIASRIWKNIETSYSPRKNVLFLRPLIKYAAVVIVIIFSCTLFYLSYRPTGNKASPITFTNQQRESRLVHLPDGSTAILNIGSTLQYAMTLNAGDHREVFLEGEAYFDIKHIDGKPFIVHTGKMQTTVLGTAFNVKAFGNDDDITVTVTRGKVRISDKDKTIGLVTVGQQMIYSKKGGNSTQNMNMARAELPWRKQDVFFDDVTVEDAAKLLEDRFHVTIQFDDADIKSKRFTTVFLKGEGLDEVLKSICEFNEATYDFDKQKTTVIIKKNNTRNN